MLLPAGPENALLGVDDVAAVPELVRAASPITHVHAAAPPFLIAHGDLDKVVDIAESRRLHEALTQAGARSSLLVLGGAGHEDLAFDEAAVLAMIAAFFHAHLSPTQDVGLSAP